MSHKDIDTKRMKIESAITETLEKVQNIFNVYDVSVHVIEDKEKIIPETGIGGFTPDSHTIFIYYDLEHENFKKNIKQEIASTLSHEFHHAVRNRTFDWTQDTLLGAMVTEGLADHFDIEMNKGKPKPWSLALSDSKIIEIEKLAGLEFNNREYNHSDWFFGSQEKNIPKWAGYAIGFKIVKEYLQKTNKKASELVSEPAEMFL